MPGQEEMAGHLNLNVSESDFLFLNVLKTDSNYYCYDKSISIARLSCYDVETNNDVLSYNCVQPNNDFLSFNDVETNVLSCDGVETNDGP